MLRLLNKLIRTTARDSRGRGEVLVEVSHRNNKRALREVQSTSLRGIQSKVLLPSHRHLLLLLLSLRSHHHRVYRWLRCSQCRLLAARHLQSLLIVPPNLLRSLPHMLPLSHLWSLPRCLLLLYSRRPYCNSLFLLHLPSSHSWQLLLLLTPPLLCSHQSHHLLPLLRPPARPRCP